MKIKIFKFFCIFPLLFLVLNIVGNMYVYYQLDILEDSLERYIAIYNFPLIQEENGFFFVNTQRIEHDEEIKQVLVDGIKVYIKTRKDFPLVAKFRREISDDLFIEVLKYKMSLSLSETES